MGEPTRSGNAGCTAILPRHSWGRDVRKESNEDDDDDADDDEEDGDGDEWWCNIYHIIRQFVFPERVNASWISEA